MKERTDFRLTSNLQVCSPLVQLSHLSGYLTVFKVVLLIWEDNEFVILQIVRSAKSKSNHRLLWFGEIGI